MNRNILLLFTTTLVFASVAHNSALARPWVPTDAPGAATNLVAWYDASTTASIGFGAGANVSAWYDKSGNTNHAIQGTPAKQPTYTASDVTASNQPSIGSITNVGSIGLLTPSITYDRVFVVCYYKDGVDGLFDVNSNIIGGPEQNSRYRVMGEVGKNSWFNNDKFNDFTYKNGSRTSTGLGSALPMPLTLWKFAAIAARTQPTALGWNQWDASRGWVGAYCEFVLTDGISAGDEDKIEGYLAWKWGLQGKLPSEHPYASEPPPEIPDAGTLIIIK